MREGQKTAIARESTADLRAQLDLRTRERDEALGQQAATADVFKVISRSAFDLQTVVDALLGSACRLCEADIGTIRYREGSDYRLAATFGCKPEWIDHFSHYSTKPDRGSIFGRTIVDGCTTHIPDVLVDPDWQRQTAQKLIGFRAALGVPLVRDGQAFGVISLLRLVAGSFSEKQIELLETFADQAVIAIQNVKLFDEVQAKTRDLEESLQQQTATSEVLQIISSSPGDLAPVFDKMLENAIHVCGAEFGTMMLLEDGVVRPVARYNNPPALVAVRGDEAYRPPPGSVMATAIETKNVAQIADLRTNPAYIERARPTVDLVELGGARTLVVVPLLRDNEVIGTITIYRQEVRPFADKHIELVSNFAKQAVIAIENARLLSELRERTADLSESLQEQTATAEVLKVINSSTGDLAPVFETILEKAHSLCAVAQGALLLYDGEKFRAVALRGLSGELAEWLRQGYVPGPNHPSRRLLEGERFAQVSDWAEIDDPTARATLAAGVRTTLFNPLRREGKLLGYIGASRPDVRPFTEKEIALLESFAAQAVMAMENARLLGEVRHRNDELAEALEFQTATGEVLRIVASSPEDLQPVFDAMLEKAIALCDAKFGNLFLYDGNTFSLVADRNLPPAYARALRGSSFSPETNSAFRHLIESKAPLHLTDMFADSSYARGEPLRVAAIELGGVRSALAVPLLRKGELIGNFSVYRGEPGGFAENQIALVTTFADQAVIAIENARLFEELRNRQAELRVTFDNMGDGVVMFGADTRLVAWNRNFQEILELPDAFLAERPTFAEYFRYLADRGEYSADLEAELSRANEDPRRELRIERTRPDGRVIEVRRNAVPGGGFVVIFSDVTERKRAEQAIRAARDAAEAALRDLQAAQASLVHAQKMAALGQLTAGIAHEIKNPLNFVNNFAGLSVELLDELKEATSQAIGAFGADRRTEILETIGMLTGNLEKIAEHGRRADGIVRGMLQHSRGSTGDWQAVDLNAVVEESLNLAYHGARAQDQDFKVTLELDLDRNLAPLEVVSQDVSRVLLNLIGNGFYAVTKRGREDGVTFSPLLKIATREYGEGVEIRVRDNGVGIPPQHCEKLFQPFFTTKPTGEGTGLGLSISYEIITQQHGGTITVDSEVGDFTEFTVRLPRRRHAVARGAA